jgi:hypothetical protein
MIPEPDPNRFAFPSTSAFDSRYLISGTWNGGADRDRTDDLKLAKLALSQLSYGPGAFGAEIRNRKSDIRPMFLISDL